MESSIFAFIEGKLAFIPSVGIPTRGITVSDLAVRMGISSH